MVLTKSDLLVNVHDTKRRRSKTRSKHFLDTPTLDSSLSDNSHKLSILDIKNAIMDKFRKSKTLEKKDEIARPKDLERYVGKQDYRYPQVYDYEFVYPLKKKKRRTKRSIKSNNYHPSPQRNHHFIQNLEPTMLNKQGYLFNSKILSTLQNKLKEKESKTFLSYKLLNVTDDIFPFNSKNNINRNTEGLEQIFNATFNKSNDKQNDAFIDLIYKMMNPNDNAFQMDLKTSMVRPISKTMDSGEAKELEAQLQDAYNDSVQSTGKPRFLFMTLSQLP